MAYSKQTWSSNELITADKLNHIENGIPTKTSQLSNDSITATSLGLGNVENKSSATIRGELTYSNVVNAIGYSPEEALKCYVLIVEQVAVNTLPVTITNSVIETDMVCIKAELSNPAAQKSDWTVNTDTAGQVTVSGTISHSTTIKLYLMKSHR